MEHMRFMMSDFPTPAMLARAGMSEEALSRFFISELNWPYPNSVYTSRAGFQSLGSANVLTCDMTGENLLLKTRASTDLEQPNVLEPVGAGYLNLSTDGANGENPFYACANREVLEEGGEFVASQSIVGAETFVRWRVELVPLFPTYEGFREKMEAVGAPDFVPFIGAEFINPISNLQDCLANFKPEFEEQGAGIFPMPTVMKMREQGKLVDYLGPVLDEGLKAGILLY